MRLGRSPTCSAHTSPPGQILTSGLGWKQRGGTDPQQGLRPPSPGRELPPTLPRSPGLLPGSASNPAGPPRETQPKPTTKNHQTPATKITFGGGGVVLDTETDTTSMHLELGEKKQALRHTHPLPDQEWQQGALLWVRRKAYMPRNVSVYSNYNTTSLIKATASFHKLHLAQCGYTRLHQFHGRYHSISMESDCYS